MTTRSIRRHVLAAALALLGSVANAADRAPLRVVLPVSAGSGVDTIVRAIAPSLQAALGGQTVIVENQPGAGGLTGTQTLVKAAPDGQTIAFVSNNHVVNPSVYKKMPFDAINDIAPVTVVGATPFVFVVNPAKVPAKNAKELQAYLKGRPGQTNFASSGNGTVIHLAGEMVVEALGADVHHVPYKGVAPMVTDIIGGQVEMGVVAVPAAQGYIKAGQLRPIGITGRQRVPSLPDVPTFAEQGFADVDIAGWFAVIAPAKTPPAEVKRLHDAVVAAFATPTSQAAMAQQSNVIAPTTPEAATAFFKSEEERYARLVKKAGVSLD